MCQALGTKERCLLVGAAGSMEKIDTKQMPSVTQSPVGHRHEEMRAFCTPSQGCPGTWTQL